MVAGKIPRLILFNRKLAAFVELCGYILSKLACFHYDDMRSFGRIFGFNRQHLAVDYRRIVRLSWFAK
jgi:hypothetical protein